MPHILNTWILWFLVTSATAQSPCSCWIEPDTSYTYINPDSLPSFVDDGSLGPLILPFQFLFFGQPQDTVFINSNGSLTLHHPFPNFMPTDFPITAPVSFLSDTTLAIIAPFWADVDLAGTCSSCNEVFYKLTASALVVNWRRVGYYNLHTDKLNSFQLIITDGSDPLVPSGANMSFCYGEMRWTTGDVLDGQNGFGGVGATVGINKGDQVGYLQVGRFDHAGIDYDGPNGAMDGVDHLDSTHVYFNVADTASVPGFTMVSFGCDTIWQDIALPLKEEVALTFLLFPNPASDHVLVNWSGTGRPDLVQLLSMDDRIVRTMHPSAGQQATISLSDLPAGAYLVRAIGDLGITMARLLKVDPH